MAENHSSTDSEETLDVDSLPQPALTDFKPANLTRTKDFRILPIPRRLRYDENKSIKFDILLQFTFFCATTFTVQNLYYCQPLLISLSTEFAVSYGEVARIPTLLQAGYAVGLLFITPLGDLVLRRPLLLLLVLLSGAFSICLAVTRSVLVFEIISFLIGIVTVTPQVLIPLTADLAPPHRRATAISITFSGLLLGTLLARVLAGIIAEFSSWRNVFYVAFGLQFCVLILLYLVLPDYPAKAPEMGYFGILKSMACAVFMNFWITLTFLLGGPPYVYSDLQIGLFGLIGILGVATGPFIGRFVDLLVPWNASLLATLIMTVSQAVHTGAGGINIVAVVVACFGLDVGRQMQQVSLSSAIFGISQAARSRLNAVYIFTIFLGQLMGTSVGTKVFVEHGWRAGAGLSLAWMGFQLIVLLLRGPHPPQKVWVGWMGGWSLRAHRPEGKETDKELSNSKGTTERRTQSIMHDDREEQT